MENEKHQSRHRWEGSRTRALRVCSNSIRDYGSIRFDSNSATIDRLNRSNRMNIPWREQGSEVEKARLLSLALKFGFDEQSTSKCSDRLVSLYEDSPQPVKNQIFLEVDSSTDSEDEDNVLGSKTGRKSVCYVPDQSRTLKFWPDDL